MYSKGNAIMFDIDKSGGKLLAAVFSLAVSAVFFATAIVPASPNGVLA
ncbi:recombination protein F [Qipengyuania aurantiaca]|uniref:Recombination protein F n=1 Tax=Qipengyuania aurantiaca TaxID=2867233 RepID=A0ABX8ZM69_9SPHN|nr:recombination protein F [Qipengyuania aurantiaca]